VDPLSPVVVRFLIWQNPSGMVRAIEEVFIDIEDCSASSSERKPFFFKCGLAKLRQCHTRGGRSHNRNPLQTSKIRIFGFSSFLYL
jgi:hypothetical protein